MGNPSFQTLDKMGRLLQRLREEAAASEARTRGKPGGMVVSHCLYIPHKSRGITMGGEFIFYEQGWIERGSSTEVKNTTRTSRRKWRQDEGVLFAVEKLRRGS